MRPDDPVADLVTRTLSNLQMMDDLASDGTRTAKPFEVTQMLNSLLSLLVVPREFGTVEYIGRSSVPPHVYADGIRKWRKSPVEFELEQLDGRLPQHLKKLLVGLRNSIAHANFDFQSESDDEISSLVLTACSRDGTPQWAATFRISELRRFLDNLGAELKAAREYQLSHPIRDAAAGVETIDFEVSLPRSIIQRIERLVAADEVTSIEKFIREAIEDQLRDDENFAAA
jgi:hypothetical protein